MKRMIIAVISSMIYMLILTAYADSDDVQEVFLHITYRPRQ
jgi:hypothetical protein